MPTKSELMALHPMPHPLLIWQRALWPEKQLKWKEFFFPVFYSIKIINFIKNEK
jgi:hypothetical protein